MPFVPVQNSLLWHGRSYSQCSPTLPLPIYWNVQMEVPQRPKGSLLMVLFLYMVELYPQLFLNSAFHFQTDHWEWGMYLTLSVPLLWPPHAKLLLSCCQSNINKTLPFLPLPLHQVYSGHHRKGEVQTRLSDLGVLVSESVAGREHSQTELCSASLYRWLTERELPMLSH